MKKLMITAAAILSVSVSLLAAPCVSAEWVQTEEGYQWAEEGSVRKEKGWLKVDGKTYFLDEKGITKHGLARIGGKLYYFRKDDEGSAFFGLKKINGKYCYFRSPEKGGAAVGWVDLRGRRYYFGEDSRAVTGLAEIDGKTYYFDEKGVMQTGLVYIDELVYDLGEDGVLISSYDENSSDGFDISWDMDEAAVRKLFKGKLTFKKDSMLVVKTNGGLRYFIFDNKSDLLTAYGTDSPQADKTEEFSSLLEKEGYVLKDQQEIHQYATLIFEKDGNYAATAGNGSSSILLYASPSLSETFEKGGTAALIELAAENGVPIG